MTSVIIPCWNALELTRVCLKQLLRWTTRPYELIAVDNGSVDGTGAWLKAFRSEALRTSPHKTLQRFHIIFNPKNRGYPAAMNQGIRAARGNLLLFGNNDAAVTPMWLENMQAALRSPIAVVGGVSAFSNPERAPGSPITWGHRPWYRDVKGLERYAAAALLQGRPVYVSARGFFSGFWFLTSQSLIRKIGPFDERYSPGGHEDRDLQWRMRRAGYQLGFAGRSYVHHIGFGCAQQNGLDIRNLYSLRRLGILRDKFPETTAVPYLTFAAMSRDGRPRPANDS